MLVQTTGMSLGECKLTCQENAVLWPRPRESTLGKEVTAFGPDDIEFANAGDYKFDSESARMIERGIAEQVEWLKKKKLGRCKLRETWRLTISPITVINVIK